MATTPLIASPTDTVRVDSERIISSVSTPRIGVNLNYLLDSDGNRPDARPLSEALKEMGVRVLRYPGGEKSDGYLWSVPPFERANPTLARVGPGEWPSQNRTLVEPDFSTFKIDPLDFDAFMAVCGELSCEPLIVVAYDGMFRPTHPEATAPTRDELLATAVEWVRYANVTQGYGIRYWQIGNETYLDHYNGTTTADQYARDLIDFSRAMKAVDPGIRIGANGADRTWWKTVLQMAGDEIDFLAVHSYPAWRWRSYDRYLSGERIDFTSDVRTAREAIASYASPDARQRLQLAITEINAIDWSEGGWPNTNDIGHALVLFDALGEILTQPDVEFSLVWNTRWIGNDTVMPPRAVDLLDGSNQLQATGRAVAIWGQFLRDYMVHVTGSKMVRAYASRSASGDALNIFLVNRDLVPRLAAIEVRESVLPAAAQRWIYTGSEPDDISPSWSGPDQCGVIVDRDFSKLLSPLSITVLELTSMAADPLVVPATDEPEGGAIGSAEMGAMIERVPFESGCARRTC